MTMRVTFWGAAGLAELIVMGTAQRRHEVGAVHRRPRRSADPVMLPPAPPLSAEAVNDTVSRGGIVLIPVFQAAGTRGEALLRGASSGHFTVKI